MALPGYIPTVVEGRGAQRIQRSLVERLLDDRIIFLGSWINDTVSTLTIAELLFLQMDNKSQDISLYINCPGTIPGYESAGLAILDTMQFIQCDIATYCVGQASGMGALILAAGTPGKRHSLPHSRLMIHQPAGYAQGTAADIDIEVEEILKVKTTLSELLSQHTGQPVERIVEDADRNFYMTPQEGKEYGLLDEIVESLKEDQSES